MSINVTPDVVWNGNDVFQSTTVNMPIPSSITAGMFLCVGIGFANAQTNTTSVTITGNTSSTAWSQFVFTGGNSPTYHFAFYKIADAGDAADSLAGGRSWTINCQDGFIEQWAGAAWSGVDTTTPFATGPGISHAATTGFSFASQTSPGSSAVWVGVYTVENNSGGITADPSSPVVKQSQSSSGFFTAPQTVYSATGVTGAFAPSGTQSAAFEWGTAGFFLNPASVDALMAQIWM